MEETQMPAAEIIDSRVLYFDIKKENQGSCVFLRKTKRCRQRMYATFVDV